MHSHNDNDNVNVIDITHNDNDNDRGRSKYAREKKVERIANELVKKLELTNSSRNFMLKVAWKLSEDKIWGNLEKSKKGDNPVGLFIYLCKRDGV